MTRDPTGSRLQDDVLERIVCRIVAGAAPLRIILFGSRADGTARPDSDYDLLIVWKDERPPPFRAAAVRKCLRGLGAAFDITVVTPSEFARLRSIPWHIAHEAEQRGRVLHAA